MWVFVEMISCFRCQTNGERFQRGADHSACSSRGIFQSLGTQAPWSHLYRCENNATNGFLKRPYHFSQDVEKQLVPRFGPGTSTCVALFSV